MLTAACVYRPECVLGEGCVWNSGERSLYFTDIERGLIHRLEFDKTGAPVRDTVYPQQARTGCFVFHREGGFVAAVTDRLVWNRPDGTQKILMRQKYSGPLRYNDGKCDRYGNLWVGTMAIDQGWPGASGGGSLYCIRGGQVLAEYPGYTIPNGLDWNGDGSVLYHIDTPRRTVDTYTVTNQVKLSNRRSVVAVPEEEGNPDGMCADENGNLWIALWGGGKVVCCDPATGGRLEEVLVPEPYVSCCCFGGVDGRDLFITTAKDENGAGGQLYRVRVGVRGGRRYLYGGNP